jgi:hypothetical protein
MNDKEIVSRRNPAIRLLGMVVITLVLWVTTYVFASMRLVAHPQSAAVRGALAAAGIVGFVPWIVVAAKAIFAQDEFTQRVHLIAIALAFASTAFVSYASDFLHRAGFIADLPLAQLWMVMGVLWWLSIMAASRYYR